jgi:hypothetical protein
MRGTALVYENWNRTANATCLAEQTFGSGQLQFYGNMLAQPKIPDPLPYKDPEPNFFLVAPMIILSVEAPTMYLTIEEQRMFQRALRRSVRVIHSAGT